MDIQLFLDDLQHMLDSEDRKDRLAAIEILGEIGDEKNLLLLRERLVGENKELYALNIAVGELMWKLGVR